MAFLLRAVHIRSGRSSSVRHAIDGSVVARRAAAATNDNADDGASNSVADGPRSDVDEDAAGVDFSTPSRERTVVLMRMNLATYPPCNERKRHGHVCGTPSDEVMRPIWESSESIFGPNVTNREAADDAGQQLHEDNLEFLLSEMAYMKKDASAPSETAEYGVGVEALEFSTTGNVTVLAFRGTFSDGDYANIENWMTDYILEKSTDRMRAAWTEDAKLQWTSEMEKRADRSDAAERLGIRAAESYLLSKEDKESFPEELAESVYADKNLSEAIGGLTIDEAEATGYWKITKHIVKTAVANLPKSHTLVLTGHSQGGTRAQFASMYINRTLGLNPPTVTFAATGSACAARLFFSDDDILDDVSPYIEYPNMVDYVHPLDPWGNAMLGVDNGGKVCFFGTEGLLGAQSGTANDSAYKYCSRVYGWSGPTVIAARTGLTGRKGPKDPLGLDQDFARCRYFTHRGATMLIALQAWGALDSEGLPDGGCRSIPIVPEDDPDRRCPTGRMPYDEGALIAGIIAIVLAITLLFAAGCFYCCRMCYRRRKRWRENDIVMFRPLDSASSGILSSFDNIDSDEDHEDEGFDNDIELPRIA